jgi:hypothetical protein
MGGLGFFTLQSIDRYIVESYNVKVTRKMGRVITKPIIAVAMGFTVFYPSYSLALWQAKAIRMFGLIDSAFMAMSMGA